MALTLAMQHGLHRATLLFILAAVVLSAWVGGLGPGLVSTILGALAASYFLLPPVHTFAVRDPGDRAWLVSFVVVAVVLSALVEILHRARREAEAKREESGALAEQLKAHADVLQREIVGRERAQASLQESELRFRDMFEQAAVGMAHVGLDGRWLRVNRRLADIVGYPYEELLGLTFQDITYPPDLDADLAQVDRLLSGEISHYQLEKRYVRKDGSVVWVNLTASLMRDAAGAPQYFVSVVEDISLRKAAEVDRARLAAIVESSEDAIVSKSLDDGTILSWNTGATRLLAYTAEEAIGRSIMLIVPPEREGEEWAILERLRRGERIEHYETLRQRKDGTRIDVSISVSPVRDEAGRLASAATIIRDISDRKRAEEELAAARLAAEAANQAKSQFLANMSHEIRTPLNAIIGYTELLELGVAGPLADAQRDYVERTRRSGRHLLWLINQVLDLAKIEADKMPVRRVPAHFADAVEGALALVYPQAISRGLVISSACRSSSDGGYLGDEDQVQQILANLLSNAVKFTEPGGRITVSCGTTRRPPHDAQLPGEGPWAYVRIEDTGVGIAPGQLARIFEPFVQVESGHTRTKGGTGLGLTISRELARLMGGDLTARSEPGLGSTFFLWLPASGEPVAPRCERPERRSEARYTSGLRTVGDAALAEIESILAAFARRLRSDPATPSAHQLNDEQLEDHTTTFLADVAQSLSVIESANGAPSDILRDGTMIRRVIAERHGAQRARLRFTEAEVAREFAILREEVAAAVRRRAAGDPSVEVDLALALLARLIEEAERASLQSFRLSVVAESAD